MPGPGQYDHSKVAHGDGPKWGMGSAVRRNIGGDTSSPGPGTYQYYTH